MTKLELYESLSTALEQPSCTKLRNRYREMFDYDTRFGEIDQVLILKHLKKYERDPSFWDKIENRNAYVYRCVHNVLEDLRKKANYPSLQNTPNNETDDNDGTDELMELGVEIFEDETDRVLCMESCLRKLAKQNPKHYALFAVKELDHTPNEIEAVLLLENNEKISNEMRLVLAELGRRYQEIAGKPEETVKQILAEIFEYTNGGAVGATISQQIKKGKLQPCCNNCFENHGFIRIKNKKS